MPLSPSLADKVYENIGILGAPALESSLRKLFKNCPYDFSCHPHVLGFLTWLEAHCPSLVIIESSLLLGVDFTDQIQHLKETLARKQVTSLISVRHIEEIDELRKKDWPRAHFFLGTTHQASFKNKISSLISERLFLDNPSLGLISKRPDLCDAIEMLTRDYALRVVNVNHLNIKDQLVHFACERPDILLWDLNSFPETEKGADEIKLFALENHLPVFYLVDHGGARKTNDGAKKDEVICLDKSSKWIGKLIGSIAAYRHSKLECCRDAQTGLYLKSVLLLMAQREISLAQRYHEKFAVLRVRIGNIQEIKENLGFIFARGIEANLGIFIKNRVRASDLVAKGSKEGEIFILLARLGRDLANLVGERLKRHFAESFLALKKNEENLIVPDLTYSVYTFPQNFSTKDVLEDLLEEEMSVPQLSIVVAHR